MELIYIDRLQDMHDRIKNNPFRNNPEAKMKYGEGYFANYETLLWTLTKAIHSDEFEGLNHFLKAVDVVAFNRAAYDWCRKGEALCASFDGTPEILEEIRRCLVELEFVLINIHLFLNTGVYNAARIWTDDCYIEVVYNRGSAKYTAARIIETKHGDVSVRQFQRNAAKRYTLSKSVKKRIEKAGGN